MIFTRFQTATMSDCSKIDNLIMDALDIHFAVLRTNNTCNEHEYEHVI